MSNRVRYKRIEKRFFRWWNLLIALFVLSFCIRVGGQVKQYFALQSEVGYYREQLAVAEADYDQQLKNQDLFDNDTYMEQMARQKLGMVKEGEEVVSILKTDLTER